MFTQLCYGYWPIETQVELNLVQIEEIVRLAGQEIRTRGLLKQLLMIDLCDNITYASLVSRRHRSTPSFLYTST